MEKIKLPLIIAILLIGSVGIGYFTVNKLATPPEVETISIAIPEGLRKEQVAFVLADQLGWTDEQIEKFVEEDTALTTSTVEGYSAPGQYEIPIDASTYDVAQIMKKAANQLHSPFKNVIGTSNWYQVLVVASIIQREMDETGSDRFDIAEKLWQKIDNNEPLRSTAVAQWARDSIDVYGESWCEGQEERDPDCSTVWSLQFHVSEARDYEWWQSVDGNQIDWEDFDTFSHSGLPPRAISNPGLNAIEAAVSSRYTPQGERISSTP